MSLSKSIEGSILGKVLGNISRSEPRTTVLGAVLAVVVASKVDYTALLNKDPNAIATLVSALVVGALGYYTNHGDFVSPTSTPAVTITGVVDAQNLPHK